MDYCKGVAKYADMNMTVKQYRTILFAFGVNTVEKIL
jgi:hypothetical protein